MIDIIHVLGASGAGTSHLGRTLEEKYGYKWLDTDYYFWSLTDPPFIKSSPREERIELLRQDIEIYPKCVISGSLCSWGDVFIPWFDLVVWVDTPTDIRIERIKKREFERFGKRILEGGDMFIEHEKFIEWAKAYDTNKPPERCRILHEEWIKKVNCPVLRLDGTKPVDELIDHIAASYRIGMK